MQISAIQNPKDALNIAFRKQAVDAEAFERFKSSLRQFAEAVQEAGEAKATEEHIKTLLSKFSLAL